ncbi:MAG TPA: O-methyltransferase [Prolixibacteraceae bacterium]
MKIDQLLENYILSHSVEEDPVLKKLYRDTHLRLVNGRMCSGHLQGTVLTLLSRLISPQRILEIGTYTGYSAICLAKGLAPGGVLHTIEINDELESMAAGYFMEAGMKDVIIQYIGDAADILPLLNDKYELAFLDGDKRQYLLHYQMIMPKIPVGGLIIADNTLWGGKVVGKIDGNDEQTIAILEFNDFVRNDAHVEAIILPIRDGMTLLRKIAG